MSNLNIGILCTVATLVLIAIRVPTSIGLLALTILIVLALIHEVRMNPIWFGVIVTKLLEVGLVRRRSA